MNGLPLDSLLADPEFIGRLVWGLLGFSAGVLVAALLMQGRAARLRSSLAVAESRLEDESRRRAEQADLLDSAEERLGDAFEALASHALRGNSETFLALARESLGREWDRAESSLSRRHQAIDQLVAPIREALDRTQQQILDLERVRQEAYGGIRAQLETMSQDQAILQAETRNLVNALRRPEVRGQWGEITLKRLVELAGMVEHCDFEEQVTVDGPEGRLRPDMLIRLPDNRQLVVDVKTPLDAYLSAVEAGDDVARNAALERHARKIGERIRELASKAYWSQFPSAPEFVILFIPGDQFLSAALARRPELLEDALARQVIIATPTSLVALLKAIAYGWRQVTLAESAKEIRDLGEQLHDRLATFSGHLARLGRQLGASVDHYNQAVGALERHVMPGARRFEELGVKGRKNLEDLPPRDDEVRMPAEPTDGDPRP